MFAAWRAARDNHEPSVCHHSTVLVSKYKQNRDNVTCSINIMIETEIDVHSDVK